MESLYRKYRPLTFESVVGQQHIVSTLEHAVAEGRLSHAYLFCGPRGTGKTTMARILAKALLCERAEGARAAGATGCNPDGTCPECTAIAEGTHPDVYELDAASRTGVDNVREEIINSVSFAPVRGAYKVYIIDEVHMLTTQAFNALLKTLEEPPAHVIFVLCTTDPQKILETILSRCQRFDFHRISNEDIVGRLRYICEQEGFEFDQEALELVARHARGGMRDALSTLEQLSVFGGGSVRVDDARALLGEVASTVLSEFACKMAVRDTVGLFGLVRAQVDEGNDLQELTRDLIAHVRDVYTAAIAGPRADLFDGTPEEVGALVEEARLFEGADRLARALTVLDDAALEMRNATDPRLVLEIALTRLARPESDLTLEALAERIARLEAQIAAGVPSAPMSADQLASATRPRPATPAPAPASAPVAASAPSVAPAPAAATVARPAAPASRAAAPSSSPRPAAPAPRPASPVSPTESSPAARPASATPGSAAPASRPAAPAPASASAVKVPASSSPEMASCAATPAVSDSGELQRRWAETVKKIAAAQPSRGGLLQSSRALGDDGETLTIGFPKGSTFALKMISRADSSQLVMPIICQVFGKRTVEYVMEGEDCAASPASAPQAQPAPAAVSAPAPAAQPQPTPAPAAQPQPQPASAPIPAPAPTSAPMPAPAPFSAQAPAPVPTSVPDRAASPAPAPEPAASPAVDQASGPTMLTDRDIDADRKAWEDDVPPYDDAFIASYGDDGEVPPLDVPDADRPAPLPLTPVASAEPAPAPTPSASAAPASAAPEAPMASGDGGSDQDSPVDPKEVLESIWGNVTFK